MNADGALIATHMTGPFGESLPTQLTPTNTATGTTWNYVGQHQKLTDTETSEISVGILDTMEEIDKYIARYQGDVRRRLDEMRRVIRETAPTAVESIAYGMPAYKLDGKPLVYFAAYPKRIGFYATPNGHEAFKHEFASYKQGKGSVQFPHDEPLPIELIRRVVEYRVAHHQD